MNIPMTGRNTLVLIPARGGSKGVPGKNLSTVAGIPLVGRAARTARSAGAGLGVGWRVVCSTDDPAIAEVARAWGAEVPFIRPPELASDSARTVDVVLHALDELKDDFDTVVLLQCTSPLTDPADVANAVRLHWTAKSPVISVCSSEHPIEWMYRMTGDGRLSPVLGGRDVHQRQGTHAAFRPSGAVYVASPETLRRAGGFVTPDTRGYVVPAERSVDVDSPIDLVLADAVVGSRQIPCVEIANKRVGPGHPCFVIAEAGVNHNGNLDLALELVDAAVRAGVDAVKFQTFRASKLVTQGAPKAEYQTRNSGNSESQYEMLKRLELDEAAHDAILHRCAERGIQFLSTPFEEESADFLERMGVPAFKLPSGEVTNLPFLRHVARKGKPMILSTGMATLLEVDAAVSSIRGTGNTQLALLHCVSEYPADPAGVNLRAMATMMAAFGCPVGFSDHTAGVVVAIAAAALGACVIEKHFTMDRSLPGPDHKASIVPEELAEMVRGIRIAELALGGGGKVPGAGERATAAVVRKSLVAACDIPAGAVIKEEHIAVRRPGTGLPPSAFHQVVGQRARIDLPAGTIITLDALV